MSEINYDIIRCPKCGHEFKPIKNGFSLPVEISKILKYIHSPALSPEYCCPKCNHWFFSYEIKRRKPASIWDILKSK